MRLTDADWPRFGWVSDIRPALADARQRRAEVVLATLVGVTGPSPRPVGTQMLFEGVAATGYFSGGCLEDDVANHAANVLADGRPARLLYGNGSPWIDIRLLCGGTLEIVLERLRPDDPATEALLDFARRRVAARWWSNGWERRVIADDPVSPAVDETSYALSYEPPWRLIVAGGDPIAMAIAHLASSAEFETTLLRPHGPIDPPPIPNLRYVRSTIKHALTDIGPDRWTAIVSATHDDKADDEVIVTSLENDAAYVGVLGSRQRIAARRERLEHAGVSPDKIVRLRGPIGALPTGKSPWEVAVSVIAEVMAERTKLRSNHAGPSSPATLPSGLPESF